MICVLRNAMGFLGELAVRAAPKSEAQKIGLRLPPEVIADIASVPPMHFPKYRLIDPLVEFAGAVIDDDDVAPAVSADAEHGAGVESTDQPTPAYHLDLAELIGEVICADVEEYGDIRSYERIGGLADEIATAVQKSWPPAPFTFGDLTWAAGVIKAYVALGPTDSETERTQLRDLADRLADAGDVDPNP